MPLGELAAVTNAVAWALGGVVAKRLRAGVRPVHIVTAQTTVTLVLLTAILLAARRTDDLLGLSAATVGLLAATSVINSVGSFIFFVNISRNSVSRVYPVTQGLFILMTLVASWLFLEESITLGVMVGAAAIVGGIVVLNSERRRSMPASAAAESNNLVLLGLAVATAVSWAANLLIVARTLENAEPLPAAILRNVIPVVVYWGFALFRPWARLSNVGRQDRLWLLAGGLLFAYAALSFTYALDNAPAGVATILLNTSPLWAVLFGVLMLRERVGLKAVSGAVLVVAGMVTTLLFE